MPNNNILWIFSVECKNLGNVFFQTTPGPSHTENKFDIIISGIHNDNNSEQPFSIQLKQNFVLSFMKKKVQDATEYDIGKWKNVLRYLFLGEMIQNDQYYKDILIDGEYIDATEDINLSIKQKYSTDDNVIYSVLGKLTLSKRQSQHEIDLASLLQASCNLLSQNTLQLGQTNHSNKQLNEYMDQFIQKKKDSDQKMMDKFLKMLNSKKQKINELSADVEMNRELIENEKELSATNTTGHRPPSEEEQDSDPNNKSQDDTEDEDNN